MAYSSNTEFKKKKLNKSHAAVVGFALLALLSICTGFILGTFAGGVGSVRTARCDKVSETSVTLTWEGVKKADGYIVYQKNGENFGEIGKADASTLSYTVDGLTPGTFYTFAVKGMVNSGSGVKESSKFCEAKACTPPDGVEFETAGSREKGKIHLTWGTGSNPEGYRIQYSKTEDFSAAEQCEFVAGVNEHTIENLEGGTPYYLRICTFIKAENEQVLSCWSPVREVVAAVKDAPYVDPTKPMIALTFDDGPGYNSASDRILDALEKYGARATFFMLGQNSLDHEENLKRKVELGCEIGNHTYDHGHLGSRVTAQDISKATEAIYKVCGVYPTAFRSPGGSTTEVIRDECEKEGMALYYWSLDTNDWKYRDSDRLYNYVLNNVSDGDIVLMHDIYESTAGGVERFLPELVARGYQLVTVSELIEAKTGAAPVPGQQYVTADTIKNDTK